MFARKVFQAVRSPNGVLTSLKSVNQTSVASLSQVAPHLPALSEDAGREYDPRRESLESFLNIRFGQNFPTINDDKNPQRDLVNFPRPVQPDFSPAHRLFIFPESWFKAFYEKTGVTGPYVALGSIGTFLLSKEWLVFEHELLVGVQATTILGVIIYKFGPGIREKIGKGVDEHLQKWDDWQSGMIKFLDEYIESEKYVRDSPSKTQVLFDAKRENIALQLEAEYRRRQMQAYQEVKRRLDFLVAKEEAEKSFQQRHMVNWIIDGVTKSITPAQEKEALKNTFADLKKLAAKSPL